jgi:hypothetical protein
VPGGRGSALSDALVRAGVPFWVLDQPSDLVGRSAIAAGRFARRYTDCIEDFFSAGHVAGPFKCRAVGRYASGKEINYPSVRPIEPNFASPVPSKFLSFLGKWEGDSAEGVYLILTPTRELKFKISTDGDTLVYTYPTRFLLHRREEN